MTKVNFGRHKGKLISELPMEYLRWGSENLNKATLRSAFKIELESRSGNISEEETTYSNELGRNVKKDYKIVLTSEQRKEIRDHIETTTEIAFDTETNSKNPRKCRMIGFSVSGELGVSYYYPTYRWNNEKLEPIQENLDECESLLNLLKGKKLIMWNASFDTQVIRSNFDIDLVSSLWVEGMVLKHIISEEGLFGLKPTGIEVQDHIGLDVEEAANREQLELYANIEKNGGSITKTNLELYKSDLEVLGPYACADADLTRRIVFYYLGEIKKQNLEKFFFEDEVMPLYREVTIPMEANGVKIDMDLILESKEEIEKDIVYLREKVLDTFWEMEEFQQWLTDTAVAKFPAKKTGNFGQMVVKQYELDLPKTAKGAYRLGKSVVGKLPDSEVKEFLLGNTNEIEGSDNISRELWIKSNKGTVNVSSKPQMSAIAFKYLGITPLAKTDKGKPKFDVTLLESAANDGHEWAKVLYNYNRLIKIRGTYIDRFLNSHEDGYYFFSYKQHGTISGRYGSDAQQLPRPVEEGQEDEIVLKYNNRIRKFFISGEGRVFIDCDYESLEPHVFAHISGDQKLIDIFNKGHDFYSTIAITAEGLDEYSSDKKAENYLGKLNKQKRQTAKSYALGIPYGMGDYALGKTLDIPTEDAKELIDNYLGTYPELKRWMDRSKKLAQTQGFIQSEDGRIRHLPRVADLHSRHKDSLLDFRYRNKLSKSYDRDKINEAYRDYKNGLNNSRNFQVQSKSASIVNKAAIAINRRFKKENIDAYCCAQVHDQLIMNAPKNKAEYCKEIIQDLMENTTKLSLKLKAPPELAVNWSEGH